MNKEDMLTLRLEGFTYQMIAEKYGCTRQNIQIALSPPKKVRDFVRSKYEDYCADCGIYIGKVGHVHHLNTTNLIENYNDTENLTYLCISCHRRRHIPQPKYLCNHCYKPIKNGLFCSKECKKAFFRIELICSICNKNYSRQFPCQTIAQAIKSKTNMNFCSKKCQGKWLAKTYGFGSPLNLFMKDTKEFWQTRREARATLDKKRANASFSEKVEVAEKLDADASFLKSGQVVSPPNIKDRKKILLAEGYRTMAKQHEEFALLTQDAAKEVLPNW